ncbi:hypothetical protein, partial [Flavobacterium filum]|uniref:hypothetical protein n=1 Tax=Flavobacterium filum TaxID=370974 RepID=UPI0023F340BC
RFRKNYCEYHKIDKYFFTNFINRYKMKLEIKTVTYDFGDYKVVLDRKGNAWVNGKYVCQFRLPRLDQNRAKVAVDKYLNKK